MLKGYSMNAKQHFLITPVTPNWTETQKKRYGMVSTIILFIAIFIHGYYRFFRDISFKASLISTLIVANCFIWYLIFIYKYLLFSPKEVEVLEKNRMELEINNKD